MTFAMGGQGALNQLRAHPFDLLLLDITMPEMDGFQVLEHLRQEPLPRHVPVIVISALTDMDSVVRCIELRARGFPDKALQCLPPQIAGRRLAGEKRLRDKEEESVARLQKEQQHPNNCSTASFPRPLPNASRTAR